MIKRTLVCVALCGLIAGGSLQAHHSLAGVYDMKGDMELAGELESVKFVNPHGSLTPPGQERGWLDNPLGDDTRFGHVSRAARCW